MHVYLYGLNGRSSDGKQVLSQIRYLRRPRAFMTVFKFMLKRTGHSKSDQIFEDVVKYHTHVTPLFLYIKAYRCERRRIVKTHIYLPLSRSLR